MSLVRSILLSLLLCPALRGEESRVTPDEVMGFVHTWMQENLEDWVFDAVGIDREVLDESLNRVQKQLSAVSSTNTEARREDADQLILLLGGFEETHPFAKLLRSFFNQHHELASPTNAAPEASAHPTPLEMRQLWLSVMTNRPAPARAHDYLMQIKPIFQAERVPSQLVWLAEVESAFDPHAKSPVGAVGLFQLMPETAESLGLSTWFPDERRNAEKNARAAARYLLHLYDRFADWQLVLAAYNAGPTRVSRLLRNSAVYSYEAIAQQLPAETRDYVAKVEAILFVREGIELASLRLAKG